MIINIAGKAWQYLRLSFLRPDNVTWEWLFLREDAVIKISRTILHDVERALSREWLVTNGIGGYASSSVVGANTRRYHGLLVASLPAPTERQVLLSRVDEEVTIGGRTVPLGTNEYHDGTIHPCGFKRISSFRLELGIPTWEFAVGGMRLTKQVWMEHRRNTVYVLYRLDESPRPVRISVRPFCAFRGYHSVGDRAALDVQHGTESVCLKHRESGVTLDLSSSGEFAASPDTYRSFLYRAERERGFSDCIEDLFTPGAFRADLHPGEVFAVIGAAHSQHGPESGCPADVLTALDREIDRRRSIVGSEEDHLRQSLLLAADQFVVRAHSGRPTIYAGYPWFTDWGRDTMIALPGILLCTRRYSEAREILLAHAESVQDGLIPNRITDDGRAEYNTADASLWYFEAVSQYVRRSGDSDLIHELYPVLESVADRHMEGTRFGIRMCPDGLLHAGIDGSQLTWMDSRVDGEPITPRIGKPVEINALWYNALSLMCSWAMHADKSPSKYEIAAAKCLTSFGRRFWNDESGCLFDVVDSPHGDDASLRPNQIIAASLSNSPLDCRRRKSVVDVVERWLLSPYGLRTLSPDDPGYLGRYSGGPSERDSAYHQGTVWPWLLGHFAEAHYRVYRDRRYIRRLLVSFREHLREAGIGSVSEVFDGDPPHNPGGCISQAWSVSELLRTIELGER